MSECDEDLLEIMNDIVRYGTGQESPGEEAMEVGEDEIARMRSSFLSGRESIVTLPKDDDDDDESLGGQEKDPELVVNVGNLSEFGMFSQTKHVFILSWSARPIFSRYGEENSLASFMGVISAIISNMETNEDGSRSDSIHSMVAGKHKFAFLLRGPIYLVAVSCKPEDSIDQLLVELDFVHLQIISILTAGAVKVLETRPTYDLRKLMGGTECVLHALINDFSTSPVYLLKSIQCLELSISTRQKISSIIKLGSSHCLDSNKRPQVLFTALLSHSKLVHVVEGKHHSFNPIDLIILMNFINNLTSLRNAESWTPICLPKFNAKGFLYAHVSYLAEEVALILVTSDPTGFYNLQLCKNYISENLQIDDTLSLVSTHTQFSISDMNIECPHLTHFLYKSQYRSQFTQPLLSPPFNNKSSRRRIFHRLKHLHSAVHSRSLAHGIYFEKSSCDSSLCLVSLGNYEFYGIFSPLISKEDAHTAAHKAVNWVSKNESRLFITTWPKRNQ